MELKPGGLGRRAFLGGSAATIAAACAPGPTTRPTLIWDDPPVARGHRLRHAFDPSAFASAPVSNTDVAIIGGGVAGLSAARAMSSAGVTSIRLLELEATLGGTSRATSLAGKPCPHAAHYLPVPLADNPDLVTFLDEMGALEPRAPGEAPVGAEAAVVREPESRVFYRGYWYGGLYPHAGSTTADQAALARFRAAIDQAVRGRGADGAKRFALPAHASVWDEAAEALDAKPATEWLRELEADAPRVRWLLDYACRDDFGLRAEETSAWAAVHYWASRMAAPGAEAQPVLAWPGGNGALVEHLARALPAPPTLGALVVRVHDAGPHVDVDYFDSDDQPRRLRARRAVLATPRFLTRRLVPALPPDPDGAFGYTPWLVAHLALRARPFARGRPMAWDNVLHDSDAVGYVCSSHVEGRDHGPVTLSWYLPLTGADGPALRHRLADLDADEALSLILDDLRRAHPGVESLVTDARATRHAHGMVQPRPGVIAQRRRDQPEAARGRLHFAHTDLSGMALFEEAFAHGTRAGREVHAALAEDT